MVFGLWFLVGFREGSWFDWVWFLVFFFGVVNVYHHFLWLHSLIYALIVKQCLYEMGLICYKYSLTNFLQLTA